MPPTSLRAGAWGVLVGETGPAPRVDGGGAVLVAADPLPALQRLATAWRRELGAQVIGVTGSTGKTSTKDLLAAMVDQQRRVVATPLNLNTEIGLPLTVLSAPAGTEVLVLEMAMRGAGQIAELVAIAEPDVGVVVNVGPVHLELLGTIEAIAATKAELIEGLRAGGTAVVPVDEPLLSTHLATLRRGRHDRDVRPWWRRGGAAGRPGTWGGRGRSQRAHAVQRAGGTRRCTGRRRRADGPPGGRPQRAARPAPGAARRARRHRRLLQRQPDVDARRPRRPCRVHVWTSRRRARRHAGARARRASASTRRSAPTPRGAGLDLLVTVGPLAAAMGPAFGGQTVAVDRADDVVGALRPLLTSGDTVLVKASRGVGLEVVAQGLAA